MIFLFTAANKLPATQSGRGEWVDFIWEYRCSNFFEKFSCHHNR
jgi:hypothetical protein